MAERSWSVASTVSSLRRVQVELCDAPPEQRRQRLEEVVTDALANTLHSEKQSFLESLLAQFPVEGDAAPPEPVAVKGATTRCARCEQYERQFQDPEVLAAQLKSVLDSAKPDVQARVRTMLGLGTSAAASIPTDEMDRLRKELGLKPDQQLDPARLADLSAASLTAVLRVAFALYDDTAAERPIGLLENVQGWSSAPRRSECVDQQEQRIKRLIQRMSEHLKGTTLTPADRKELAAAMLDATRILRLPVTSIQNCGPRFWALFQDAFAPDKLEGEAPITTNRVGLGSTREEQLWNRYVQKFTQWKRDKWGQNKGGGASVGADDVRAMIEQMYPLRR